METLDDADLVEERLTRVIAAELQIQIEMHRPLKDIPELIADEIMRGFEVRLRESGSGSYGPEPALPDRPVRVD